MFENRKSIRVAPRDQEFIEIQIMGSGFIDILHARDISETGIGIEVPYLFEGCDIDQPIDLVITLPGEICFKAKGFIKHTNAALNRKGIFGVEFSEIGTGYLKEIRRYINSVLDETGSRTPEKMSKN